MKEDKMSGIKPKLTWRDFLSGAPYFHSSLFDQVEYENASALATIPKAAYFYGLFDAEVCNGGVMQYFFNLAFLVPDFEKAPEFVAAHPVLQDAVPFIEKVHKTWEEKREAVHKARMAANETEEWPETLFSDTSFDELEEEFYDINHRLMAKLDHHVLQNPEQYYDLEPLSGMTGKGVEHIQHHGSEMRFVDGFPEGPNLIKVRNGVSMVWISSNRNRLDYRIMDFFGENPIHGWIDYPTHRSQTVDYNGPHISTINNQIANWYKHGSQEQFAEDGQTQYLEFSCENKNLLLGHRLENGGDKNWDFREPEE